MNVEVGKRYYFWTHAYHHIIAEVVEITGKREASVRFCSWIYSSTKDWTAFFKEGAGENGETKFHKFPPMSITWFNTAQWVHNIPGYEKEGKVA